MTVCPCHFPTICARCSKGLTAAGFTAHLEQGRVRESMRQPRQLVAPSYPETERNIWSEFSPVRARHEANPDG
jgi:hypothetical protein